MADLIQQELSIPDLGGATDVTVVEVFVSIGDSVDVDDSLVALESEKASMDVPSTHAGTVVAIHLAVGDTVEEGALVATLEVVASQVEATDSAVTENSAIEAASTPVKPEPAEATPPVTVTSATRVSAFPVIDERSFAAAYAGPAVRRFARELGVDLGRVTGSGRKGRIVRQDVVAFVMQQLAGRSTQAGSALPPMPKVDFAKFGPIKRQPLTRIQKASGPNLHRSWLHVPHVTQFDEADITDLERYRKKNKPVAAEQGIRLTPLAFVLQAVAAALQEFPLVNASIDADAGEVILKKSYHLGVAVDTPGGLVVPVVRDVDQKGALAIATELGGISARAREGKLRINELQGASFTVSSLGGIGGTGFSPIVNSPEVGILGVARSRMTPVFVDGEFVPRLMLPFSLSYDHRVVDGALGVRFTTFLGGLLADPSNFQL